MPPSLLSKEDRRNLERVIKKVLAMLESGDDGLVAQATAVNLGAFENMLRAGRCLSDRQRSWLGSMLEKLFDEPQYKNLASSGKLCRGRPVETPEILKPENLPKKPPARKPCPD